MNSHPDREIHDLAREVCPCKGDHNPAMSIECAWALDLARAALGSKALAAREAAAADRVRAAVLEWAEDEGFPWESSDNALDATAGLRAALATEPTP